MSFFSDMIKNWLSRFLKISFFLKWPQIDLVGSHVLLFVLYIGTSIYTYLQVKPVFQMKSSGPSCSKRR